jgi:hypothetical protein
MSGILDPLHLRVPGTMSFARNVSHTRLTVPTSGRRWFVVGLLSLLLHLVAINWVNGNLRLPGSASDDSPSVIQTRLVQLPPPAAEATPPPSVMPVAARAAKPRPKPPASPKAPTAPPTTTPSPPVATNAPPVMAAAAADTTMSTIAPSAASPPAAEGSGIPDIAAPDAAAATLPAEASEKYTYKFDPPPSATLKYDVQALREGQTMHGHGKIAWKLNGSQYMINGEAGILFISLLDFGSRGQVDEFGIAPAQYTEKRIRRQQTETRFNRESKLISFSASPKSFPLQGGEQDRASIIWQLASIGRGDASRFTPGAQIPLFIAGVRDGSTWNIQVIGEEDVKVKVGSLRAWHVRRAPRTGDKDQILDIWLAPSLEWYPVKLRYTETNGEYLELSLSNIEAPAS